MAGRHVELREIDYAEVLRERDAAASRRSGTQIIASCLQGERVDARRGRLREPARASPATDERLADSDRRRSKRAATSSRRHRRQGRRAAPPARGIVDAVAQEPTPSGSSRCCATWPRAVGQLSPDMMLALLAHRDDRTRDAPAGRTRSSAGCPTTTIAASSRATRLRRARRPNGWRRPSRRWCANRDQRERLLALAHDDAAASPLGEHGRLRGGLEPRRREAADARTPTSRSCPTTTRASCRARARRRSRSNRSTTTRRSAWRLARHGGDQRAARARPDAGPRSAADRAGRRSLGRR